ncbi:apolipoprotein C-I [Lissotriton helveticus]
MKLLLSLAVLLVTVAVMTDVTKADDSPSVVDRLKEFASNVGDKTKEVFNKIHHSEPATKTRNWFAETFQRAKDALNIKSK